MSTADIIRAWKDQDYLMNLSPSELAQIPENPAGKVELMRATTNGNPDISFIFPPSKCCTQQLDCSRAVDCTIDTHCT
ncbi:MAG TPA: mersacidin/lichenicidin family type 2 lantibiotic [Candidatus Angelobacter sp.]